MNEIHSSESGVSNGWCRTRLSARSVPKKDHQQRSAGGCLWAMELPPQRRDVRPHPVAGASVFPVGLKRRIDPMEVLPHRGSEASQLAPGLRAGNRRCPQKPVNVTGSPSNSAATSRRSRVMGCSRAVVAATSDLPMSRDCSGRLHPFRDRGRARPTHRPRGPAHVAPALTRTPQPPGAFPRSALGGCSVPSYLASMLAKSEDLPKSAQLPSVRRPASAAPSPPNLGRPGPAAPVRIRRNRVCSVGLRR